MGWTRIGEFARALALVDRMGTASERGLEYPIVPDPRLDALRAIGIAMLEQGALPPSYLDDLTTTLRPAVLSPTP